MTDKKSKKDTWKKTEVQKDGIFRNEPEVPAERKFCSIDSEVEPASCADHHHFCVSLGKKVESRDGSCGVGDHCGNSCGPSASESQHWVSCDEGEELGAGALNRNDSDKNKNDPTQSVTKSSVGIRGMSHQPVTIPTPVAGISARRAFQEACS